VVTAVINKVGLMLPHFMQLHGALSSGVGIGGWGEGVQNCYYVLYVNPLCFSISNITFRIRTCRAPNFSISIKPLNNLTGFECHQHVMMRDFRLPSRCKRDLRFSGNLLTLDRHPRCVKSEKIADHNVKLNTLVITVIAIVR